MVSKTRAARISNNHNGQNFELVQRDDNSPLPPAEALEKLHSFRPDLVDVAVKMSQEEAESRRKKEEMCLKYAQRDNLLIILCASILCLVSIIGGCIIGYLGHETASFAVCGIPIAIIISSFFKHKK